MKMFNMIDIGERAGSGIPTLFSTWKEQGWENPVIEERFGEASRTTVTLSFHKNLSPQNGDKKAAIKGGDKITPKMQRQFDAILTEMKPDELHQALEFCDVLGVKISRTKIILKKMADLGLIETVGANKDRRYKRK